MKKVTMKHKCEKMPSEVNYTRDLSFVHFYYDDKEKETIYYCHYCGIKFKVEEVTE